MSEYKLTTEILKRSVGKNWDIAVREWDVHKIYRGSPDSCLCGHYPIIEICIIKNLKNGENAVVGNCCVQKFMGLSSDKLFAATKRVKANIENPLNAAVIEYSFKKGYINDRENKFYLDTWRKRKTSLTPRQLRYRVIINKKILTNIKV